MNILFFTTTHNSLSQRAYVEPVDRGHRVILVVASSEDAMRDAVEREHPDLIVAPMLKKIIPATIWQKYTCLIVHPGIKGDGGHRHWTGLSSMGARNGASPSYKQTLTWMLALSWPGVLLP
jgi:hypothetical protein